jgi:hypothetical protein
MHYLGMAAMNMPDSMHHNTSLFIMSVVIAVVAGTAALWAISGAYGSPGAHANGSPQRHWQRRQRQPVEQASAHRLTQVADDLLESRSRGGADGPGLELTGVGAFADPGVKGMLARG